MTEYGAGLSCSSKRRVEKILGNLAHGPFDWVIVDTPPVLAVTDAVIVAPWVSGVAFVPGAMLALVAARARD